MNILITGGAGYIGSVLSRELLKKGYTVRVLDNLTYGDEGIKDLLQEKNFEFKKGDIRDISAVADAVKGIDAVIHLAAIVGDQASALNPETTLEINYLATKTLAEACKYGKVQRFLFASTCSVYGASPNSETKLSEDASPNPLSLYAQTKLRSEQGIKELADSNFSPTILRLATVYGYSPRMRFDLVINTFIGQAFFDKKITIFGGSQWRPFVHVRDVAGAFMTCLESPLEKVKNQIFNVGSDSQNYTILTVADHIQNNIPNVKQEVIPTQDQRDYVVSFKKIEKELGFQVNNSIDDAAKEIVSVLHQGTIGHYKEPRYSDYESLLYVSQK